MPEAVFIVFAGIAGAVVGSFLSVLITRLPKGEDVVWRRSHCALCKHVLGVRDLIPLVSFIWQRGRCRYCGRRIASGYFFLEFGTAALFAATVLTCRSPLECFGGFPFFFWWFVWALLIVVAAIDAFHLVIPERALFLGGGALLVARSLTAPAALPSALAAAVVGGGLFAVIAWVSGERWMGWGDAMLGAFLGFLLGFPAIAAALLIASLLGGVWGSMLLAMKKAALGARVPFAPFLIAGAGATVFLWPVLTRTVSSFLFLS